MKAIDPAALLERHVHFELWYLDLVVKEAQIYDWSQRVAWLGDQKES